MRDSFQLQIEVVEACLSSVKLCAWENDKPDDVDLRCWVYDLVPYRSSVLLVLLRVVLGLDDKAEPVEHAVAEDVRGPTVMADPFLEPVAGVESWR